MTRRIAADVERRIDFNADALDEVEQRGVPQPRRIELPGQHFAVVRHHRERVVETHLRGRDALRLVRPRAMPLRHRAAM